MTTTRILIGDVRERLRDLDPGSVHCCVTSPPYWGLRDYGVDGQIGLEDSPDAWVAEMVAVFAEVWRVLRDDGTLWLNLGDSYAHGGNGSRDPDRWPMQSRNDHRVEHRRWPAGLKPKDLIGQPWRVAFALQAAGWYLRSAVVWAKPNPMPESCRDRPTSAYEHVFLLTKRARYYYDADAVREKVGEETRRAATFRNGGPYTGNRSFDNDASNEKDSHGDGAQSTGRNLRNVWTINPEPTPEAHFATFPQKLVEPCILAGASERGCCPECGAPWERVVERDRIDNPGHKWGSRGDDGHSQHASHTVSELTVARTTGWRPACDHDAEPRPCTVLDPFGGSGTVAYVAAKLQRDSILCELNPEYVEIAERRLAKLGGMYHKTMVTKRPGAKNEGASEVCDACLHQRRLPAEWLVWVPQGGPCFRCRLQIADLQWATQQHPDLTITSLNAGESEVTT